MVHHLFNFDYNSQAYVQVAIFLKYLYCTVIFARGSNHIETDTIANMLEIASCIFDKKSRASNSLSNKTMLNELDMFLILLLQLKRPIVIKIVRNIISLFFDYLLCFVYLTGDGGSGRCFWRNEADRGVRACARQRVMDRKKVPAQRTVRD